MELKSDQTESFMGLPIKLFSVSSQPSPQSNTLSYNVPDGVERNPDVLRAEMSLLSSPVSEAYSEVAYNAIRNVQNQCAVDYKTHCTNEPIPFIMDMDINTIFNKIFAPRKLVGVETSQSEGAKLVDSLRSYYRKTTAVPQKVVKVKSSIKKALQVEKRSLRQGSRRLAENAATEKTPAAVTSAQSGAIVGHHGMVPSDAKIAAPIGLSKGAMMKKLNNGSQQTVRTIALPAAGAGAAEVPPAVKPAVAASEKPAEVKTEVKVAEKTVVKTEVKPEVKAADAKVETKAAEVKPVEKVVEKVAEKSAATTAEKPATAATKAEARAEAKAEKADAKLSTEEASSGRGAKDKLHNKALDGLLRDKNATKTPKGPAGTVSATGAIPAFDAKGAPLVKEDKVEPAAKVAKVEAAAPAAAKSEAVTPPKATKEAASTVPPPPAAPIATSKDGEKAEKVEKAAKEVKAPKEVKISSNASKKDKSKKSKNKKNKDKDVERHMLGDHMSEMTDKLLSHKENKQDPLAAPRQSVFQKAFDFFHHSDSESGSESDGDHSGADKYKHENHHHDSHDVRAAIAGNTPNKMVSEPCIVKSRPAVTGKGKPAVKSSKSLGWFESDPWSEGDDDNYGEYSSYGDYGEGAEGDNYYYGDNNNVAVDEPSNGWSFDFGDAWSVPVPPKDPRGPPPRDGPAVHGPHPPHGPPHGPPPPEDIFYNGALGFSAEGDMCMYENFNALSQPCMESVADLYQLREEYWHDVSAPPPPRCHGFLFIVFAIAGACMVRRCMMKGRVKKVQNFLSALHANPELKARVEAETGLAVPELRCPHKTALAAKAGDKKPSCLARFCRSLVFFCGLFAASFFISTTSLEITANIVENLDRDRHEQGMEEGTSITLALTILFIICTIQVLIFSLLVRAACKVYVYYYPEAPKEEASDEYTALPSADVKASAPPTTVTVRGTVRNNGGGDVQFFNTGCLPVNTTPATIQLSTNNLVTPTSRPKVWGRWSTASGASSFFSMRRNNGYAPVEAADNQDTEMIQVVSGPIVTSAPQQQYMIVPVTASPMTNVNLV